LSADEIGRDAETCAAAGASIYHLHVRDDQGAPTMDVGAFENAKRAIEQRTDLIVQFTTGGVVGDPEDERIAPLELRPPMASLTTGTVNFGEGVFSNPPPLINRLYRRMRELGIVPEFEIFEAGMIATAERLVDGWGGGHHRHFDLVLGVPGGMPAWPDAIPFLVAHLPEGATWSATGIGKAHLAVAKQAIAMGGHVRTGFEDVRFFAPGELVSSNAQLIRRVAEMATSAGRDIATPAEARKIIGLT
jgi:3-keto-5-aminohexanoate cleavage enzyme